MLPMNPISVGNAAVPLYFENTALFPLTDLFQRLWQFQADDSPEEKVGKTRTGTQPVQTSSRGMCPTLCPLLSLPIPENHYLPLNLSPQRQRQKHSKPIVAILLELAERQPVLFILEDLHWTDPTTLELLNLVIEQIPTTSMLTVLNMSSHVPTFLESPILSHRDHGQSLVTDPGGTNRYRLPAHE